MPHIVVTALHQLLDSLPEPLRAALLGALVALLRILYDGREPRWVRRMLEAALCGAIALAVAHLTTALGLASGWGTFLGASVGLFGADQVREWGRRVANSRMR
jgi:lambda family phage holin